VTDGQTERSITLLGATRIGIGAIVGGGILVLAGPAFLTTGPSVVLAFALNGILAFMTAMSFAEMASAYPRSGGAYAFGRRVLSVRAAFGAGWVLWLAYIVAGVLYALGFGVYAARLIMVFLDAIGLEGPAWLAGHGGAVALATIAIGIYTLTLIREATGGGDVAAWGKVVVLGVLVLVGLWALLMSPSGTVKRTMLPFMPHGSIGFISAMGLSFIALQGFDLVATVASEVKDPEKNIPKAMFYSLGTALGIYLPLLVIVACVGVDASTNIRELAGRDPDTLMATAVGEYMGPLGTWLVLIAAVLATLSALNANLLAASRVAHTMAKDRTLPWIMGVTHETRGTPVMALYTSALAMGALLFMVPDLSTAGAAAGLIFLVSFALTHVTAYLARTRSTTVPEGAYTSPWFPFVPIVGGIACAALAIFQLVAQPNAGAITLVWFGLGVVLYRGLFSSRAEVVDAAAEAGDAELVQLRDLSPLMLVPVHNPQNAAALVQVASLLTPPVVGRVLLLSVARQNALDADQEIRASLAPVERGMARAVQAGRFPEAMTTVAEDPWEEIARVARERGCERMLMGLTELDSEGTIERLERLFNNVNCDLSILRAPPDWELTQVKRVLVPVGGQGNHDELRARLLASLGRQNDLHVNFLRVVGPGLSAPEHRSIERDLQRRAAVEVAAAHSIEVVESEDVLTTITERVKEHDLVVLGLQRSRKHQKTLGQLSIDLAQNTDTAMILLGGRNPTGLVVWRP
jgi:basic amino acid/polyamine antiporter, APA family